MPPHPGKHKSKLKSNNNAAEFCQPIQLFLSRQGSRVEGLDARFTPIALSRIQSQVHQQENEINDVQHLVRRMNVNLNVDNKEFQLGEFNCKVSENDQLLWVNDLIRNLKMIQCQAVDSINENTIQIKDEYETKAIENHPYYTPNLPVYQNVGVDPLPNNTYIKIGINQHTLNLRIRPSKSSLLDNILNQQPNEDTNSKKNQKTKQRTLSQVVERVALWRRLYTGFYDQNRTFIQMSLDKAAEKVGISKKTLDDYLLQIRYGKRFGFDFKRHSSEGISKLRQFVKSRKDLKKNDET